MMAVKSQESSLEEIQRERINRFSQRFEQQFGKKNPISSNKQDNPRRGFALNYYGIKSDWL